MKHITIITISLVFFVVGCSKNPVPNQHTAPITPSSVEPAPAPTTPVVPKTPKHWPSAYIRGYNDGYDANWLSPLNWTIRGDYRAGWSAGQRDRKNGLPNKFE